MAQGKPFRLQKNCLPLAEDSIHSYTILVNEHGSPTGDYFRRNTDETDTFA
jgi:hypothetical protein